MKKGDQPRPEQARQTAEKCGEKVLTFDDCGWSARSALQILHQELLF